MEQNISNIDNIKEERGKEVNMLILLDRQERLPIGGGIKTEVLLFKIKKKTTRRSKILI